ncbi:MAG TPA: discoidin domain-containing protein [Rhodopila sp.]|uniref:discoidin domain-containing protein n=1 Tax=Rhodopila sp. TaxID=2480087 RepID=UPI002B8D7666|nr:discoidin domain-containing protein [Rhodopila sp.]HVY18279.1 discoidin domain-containing protein [Rhodopila sp.]
MGPLIRIVPRGNLGNRMLQYMAALRLRQLVPGSVIEQVALPEWTLNVPASARTKGLLLVDTARKFDLAILSERMRQGDIGGVVLQDYLQDVRFYDGPAAYRSVFRPDATDLTDLPTFQAGELVINVRGGEILQGIYHYPLVPIPFYQDIVRQTGLSPVIMGQLDDGPFCTELRRTFPNARFIPSQGAIRDFHMIRSARHVIPSVSTFSWLASWLSDAVTIHQPLLGFYNPCHEPEINLVATGDPRWKFYLFPLCYGMPQEETLRYYKEVGVVWTYLPHEQIAYIVNNRPFVRTGSAVRRPDVDWRWYVRQYPKAAQEIAEGWYEDVQHHYETVGHLRGYQPGPSRRHDATPPPDLAFAGENLAFNRPTSQSSVSPYSRAPTVERDSAGAVDGNLLEPFAFHTSQEDKPWWQVELAGLASIEAVVVYNRVDHPVLTARAAPLAIQFSSDGRAWTTVYTTEPDAWIGGADGKPLTWRPTGARTTRFVRLQVQRTSFLHLVEVQVFGTLLPAG